MSELPPTPAADDGSADPRLLAALDRGGPAEVLAALAGARVFAAIAATSTAEHVTEHGLRAESTAEMAVLLLESEGERALPVFSSVGALRRWRLDARPVPLSGPQACQAALDEGAGALVLDATVQLTGSDLQSLASGWVPVAGSALASRHADTELRPPAVPVPEPLLAALRRAVAPEGLRAARLLEGPDGLVLGVAPRRPLDAAGLAALAHRVMTALGAQLPPEGLDLAQVAPRGPGIPLVRRGLRRRVR
jgi:hypothetical protein